MSRVFCIGNGESRRDYNLQNLRQYGTIYGCNALYRDFIPDVLTSVDHGIMHEIYHAGMAQKIPCYFRDWTKVPAGAYESMISGGLPPLEVKEAQRDFDIIVSNEREDSDEFVIHGSNLKGIVSLIKRQGGIEKRNINNTTIKVSWIKKPDYSHSLSDIMIDQNYHTKDLGWSAGPSSGYVACHREKPKELFMIGHDLNSTTNKINNMYKSTKHYTAAENGPTPSVNWIRQWWQLMKENPNTMFYKVNQFNDGRDAVNGPITEWGHNKTLPNLKYIDYSTLDNMLKG